VPLSPRQKGYGCRAHSRRAASLRTNASSITAILPQKAAQVLVLQLVELPGIPVFLHGRQGEIPKKTGTGFEEEFARRRYPVAEQGGCVVQKDQVHVAPLQHAPGGKLEPLIGCDIQDFRVQPWIRNPDGSRCVPVGFTIFFGKRALRAVKKNFQKPSFSS
jgi:hypothetical protein